MAESAPLAAPDLSPIDVPGLLRQFGIHPDKRLGQNFLISRAALEQVIQAAEILPGELVLEVGAGLGCLTRYLATLAGQVVAVEIDADLIPPLEQVLSGYPGVRVIVGDILAIDPAGVFPNIQSSPSDTGYLVVANIPYYITSALIRHLLEAQPKPTRLVLTVQREVAERITARPGRMSLLALSVQVYGQPRVMSAIPAGAFYPSPKVDSAVTRVDIYPSPLIPAAHLDDFFRLAKAGFSQKRKTLRNALAGGMHWKPAEADTVLRAAAIDPQRRAETLSLAEWGDLVQSYRLKIAG